jgi:hypothetical protein
MTGEERTRFASPAGDVADDADLDAPERGASMSRDAEHLERESDDFETPRAERKPSSFATEEPTPIEDWEERSPEPTRAPSVNNDSVDPAPARSFGRGRRRDAAAAAAEGRARGGSSMAPATAPPAEDKRVDVFAASPASESEPLSPATGTVRGHDPGVPVVDVAADEGGEVENDREREARIDEMERALESFGRRRPPDYGRRGRRR